jgi:hypothetical protein
MLSAVNRKTFQIKMQKAFKYPVTGLDSVHSIKIMRQQSHCRDLFNFFGNRMHLLNLLFVVYLGVQQSLQRPSLAITASTEDPVQGAGLDLSCQLVGGEVRGSALSWHKVGSQLASNVFTRGNLLRY